MDCCEDGNGLVEGDIEGKAIEDDRVTEEGTGILWNPEPKTVLTGIRPNLKVGLFSSPFLCLEESDTVQATKECTNQSRSSRTCLLTYTP